MVTREVILTVLNVLVDIIVCEHYKGIMVLLSTFVEIVKHICVIDSRTCVLNGLITFDFNKVRIMETKVSCRSID